MNDCEFEKSLGEVQTILGDIPTITISHIRSKYLTCSSGLWTKMCAWILEHCRFAPKPVEFRKAYEACNQTWREEKATESPGCPDCRGGFQPAFYIANGMPYQGIIPCLVCNSNQHVPKGHVKIERFINSAEYQKLLEQNRNPELRSDTFSAANHGADVKTETLVSVV